MEHYRLYLWSRDGGASEQPIADEATAPLLDTLTGIGRRAVRSACPPGEATPDLPAPSIARARHLLRVARRLLEEAGEQEAAARATMTLMEIGRK